MSILDKQKELIKKFENLTDWEEKYTLIIQFGKQMPAFPEELKVDKNKIEGCQSQVWINAKLIDGKVIFSADSDAMIVKGLIAILIDVYSNQTPNDILSSPPDFLKTIGIDNHLSPTRKNGLGAMLKQIQLFAFAFKSLSKNQG
ncbi:MAG: SufE family protein [bacterium]